MRKQRRPLAGRADRANENLREAMRTGARFNGLSGKWLMGQADLTRVCQHGFAQCASVSTDVVSISQKQAGALLELMGQSVQAKVGLMGQALDASQSRTVSQRHAKWTGFWLDAFKLAQSNADAVTQINNGAINSWLGLVVRHNGTKAERLKG